MTHWEYFVAPLLEHNPGEILNTFGEDGWELVACRRSPRRWAARRSSPTSSARRPRAPQAPPGGAATPAPIASTSPRPSTQRGRDRERPRAPVARAGSDRDRGGVGVAAPGRAARSRPRSRRTARRRARPGGRSPRRRRCPSVPGARRRRGRSVRTAPSPYEPTYRSPWPGAPREDDRVGERRDRVDELPVAVAPGDAPASRSCPRPPGGSPRRRCPGPFSVSQIVPVAGSTQSPNELRCPIEYAASPSPNGLPGAGVAVGREPQHLAAEVGRVLRASRTRAPRRRSRRASRRRPNTRSPPLW